MFHIDGVVGHRSGEVAAGCPYFDLRIATVGGVRSRCSFFMCHSFFSWRVLFFIFEFPHLSPLTSK